jgi:SAM-dependent methyltransferase
MMMKSTSFYSRRATCRLCDSADVACVFRLEPSALAEWYLPPERAHEALERFPLDLFLCRSCGHVQLFDVIDPERLFCNYVYKSATSPGLDEHFRRYADHVVDKLALRPGARVVDVGSNDGTLLRHFARRAMGVLGIDPAQEIARAATEAGIPTLNAFLDEESARRVVAEHGAVQVCTANNVFAHNDHLGGMAGAVARMLANDGAFVFEVSYLLDTVEGLVFDFIYHEHLCYHSVRPMDAFLRRHGMHLFDVERVASKGGSLRGFAQKLGGPRPVSPRVAEFVAREEAAGLYDPATYQRYIDRVNQLRDQTVARLHACKARGMTVAGYGASATVTTLMHHFRIGTLIDFLVDDNPIRHGTVSPGFQVPVYHADALYTRKPDLVVVLAWRFAEGILRAHANYLRQGGTFLIPLPTFQEQRERQAA